MTSHALFCRGYFRFGTKQVPDGGIQDIHIWTVSNVSFFALFILETLLLIVYNRSKSEWDKLAAWIVDNSLFSPNVRWLIQVPRLYNIYKSSNVLQSFSDLVRNLFEPLFEVTRDPTSHPKLHVFLQRVVGFDSVDDESKPEKRIFRKFPTPLDWDNQTNPPYSYYLVRVGILFFCNNLSIYDVKFCSITCLPTCVHSTAGGRGVDSVCGPLFCCCFCFVLVWFGLEICLFLFIYYNCAVVWGNIRYVCL